MVTAVVRPKLRLFSGGGGLLCDNFSSARCSNPCIFLDCHVRCTGIHITCPDPEGPCAAGGDCAPIAGPHLTGLDTKAHIPECLLNLLRVIGGDPRVIWGAAALSPRLSQHVPILFTVLSNTVIVRVGAHLMRHLTPLCLRQ